MPNIRVSHFRHHGRFYFAAICGIAIWLIPIGDKSGVRLPIGGATFFVLYLISTFWVARRTTPGDLREKANMEDEGILVIIVITLAAITLSLGSLALLLWQGGPPSWTIIPALANVPLGWATLHTVMAFHYAHLFYTESDEPGAKSKDSGGLEFPGTEEPAMFDFIYYSFVVGMTAQVSDVDTTSRQIRNTTTLHGVVSFFFNTVILAFSVNTLSQK